MVHMTDMEIKACRLVEVALRLELALYWLQLPCMSPRHLAQRRQHCSHLMFICSSLREEL